MTNPTGRGGFQPGQSGNPKGRPKKERALTTILEKAGGRTIEVDGKRIAGRQLVARMAWEGVTTGQVSFPDGKTLKLSPADWKDLLKWIYQHVDGPPRQEVDLTSGGEPLEIGVTTIDYRSGIAPLAPRPVSDSDTSSQDKNPGDGSEMG